MAVMIIEDKPDPKVVRNATCKMCGVKLEFLPVDVQKKNYKDITGCTDTWYWIDCPKCDNSITVGAVS